MRKNGKPGKQNRVKRTGEGKRETLEEKVSFQPFPLSCSTALL